MSPSADTDSRKNDNVRGHDRQGQRQARPRAAGAAREEPPDRRGREHDQAPHAAEPAANIKGGIVEREAALHASNVQLVCPECGKMTRIGHQVLDDGRKVRICRKCEGVVDK